MYCFFFLMIRRPPRSTLFSLHDALPISGVHADAGRVVDGEVVVGGEPRGQRLRARAVVLDRAGAARGAHRSEEHTSELQSRLQLVCRLLLVKKKKKKNE